MHIHVYTTFSSYLFKSYSLQRLFEFLWILYMFKLKWLPCILCLYTCTYYKINWLIDISVLNVCQYKYNWWRNHIENKYFELNLEHMQIVLKLNIQFYETKYHILTSIHMWRCAYIVSSTVSCYNDASLNTWIELSNLS